MSALTMIRLNPDIGRAMEWGAREEILKPGGDDGYLWHVLLKRAFGEHAPKPFRLVEPRGGGEAYLLGYTASARESLAAHAAAYADPTVAEALRLSSLGAKAMPEVFAAGHRLGFEVRLRPVVRQTLNGDRDRKREIDVYLQRCLAQPEAPKPERTAVYREWLAAALRQGGASLDVMSIAWLRRFTIIRRGASRDLSSHGKKGGGPDLCLRGTLTVVEPAKFQPLLARGVGRHRSFGFGMLLLKPP
jgi:CRISPR system Cascade subunit CasE